MADLHVGSTGIYDNICYMGSSGSISDGLSGVSTSLSSNSFTVSSPPPLHARSRAHLSPVTEGKIAKASSSTSVLYPDMARTSEPGFDMVTRCTLRTCPSTATLTLLLLRRQQ